MAKIVGLLLFSVPILLWSNNINRDSIINLIPENFTGQIVVKKDNNFLFKENFGPKERVFKTLINDSTVFNIGQVSQTIISYLFEDLQNKGQIKVNEKAAKYINTFPYKDVQIKHLLEHTSGLPHFYVKLYHRNVYNNWNLTLSERERRFDNEDILNILITEKPILTFTPGDSTAYSDINYLILTSLIEKITNTSFKNYVKEIFLQELHFQPILSAEKDTIFNKAYGYRLLSDSSFQLYENLKTRDLPFNDGTYGNQHIYLSASNLAFWGNFLLKKINLDNLKKQQNKYTTEGLKFDKNVQTITKNGAFGGVSSKLILIPKNQIVIVINSSLLNLNEKSKEFAPLEDYLQKLD